MSKISTFEYDGRALEVRAEAANDQWQVRVYENGAPATAVVYQVAGTQAVAADVVDHLMHHAEKDVTKGLVALL